MGIAQWTAEPVGDGWKMILVIPEIEQQPLLFK